MKFALGLVLLAMASATALNGANTLSLTPFSCCDGQFITTNAGGHAVWQNVSGSSYLDFIVPASFAFTSGAPVYVQAVYYDDADGRIDLQYDEGTAVMPLSDDPRATAPDWWLLLTNAARDTMLGNRPLSRTLPSEAQLGNQTKSLQSP